VSARQIQTLLVKEVEKQKPTAVRQWVDEFRERIKTRLPRRSAARL
jgi:hypothetical protein